MNQRLPTAVLLAVAVACAVPSRAPSPAPIPEPVPSVAQVPSPTPPRMIPGVRLASQDPSAIPPFATEPLIAWGPEPEGTVHAPVQRQFDLQRQIVNVRFDWARHAVVGTTTLRFAALNAPLTSVRLNAVGMTIKRASSMSSGPLKFDYDDTMLVVHLPRMLPAHALSSLTIDYESVKPKKGVYFIDRNHYLWTQGETEDNRYWIPTYDHPDDKTTWEISVLAAPGEQVLSNGRLVSSRKSGAGVRWTWSQDRPASTYLMSVVTGRYAVVRDHWKGIPVEYWTYPDSVEAARLGFGQTPQAIDVFSRKTGVAFPWAKYAQSVVPDFIFGGMENVSATTQNDDEILHPRWAEPQANAAGLMSHELGHQWYGDLLTTADWSHAWLNEGFATFMEQIFREESLGVDDGAWDRLEAQAQTIEADRKNRRPIVYNKWVKAPLELFFSGHIYPKGATVLQMMRHQLGDSLFWHAMNHYTVAHSYKNVVSEDLRRSFEEATGRNFKTLFDQWVYGAGFPVFQVSFTYDTTVRRIALHAREIQPRDSLTGYFDADVDVEVLTARGPVRGVMPVRSGSGELSLALADAPLAIDWNRGKWLLALTDFPRSTAMLGYELAHSDDVTSREEALVRLRQRTSQPAAASAIAAAATGDRFWGIRQLAVQSLAQSRVDSTTGVRPMNTAMSNTIRSAVSAAIHDRDARVRQAAVNALGSFTGGDAQALLAGAAQHDSSLFVRGDALASYLGMVGDEGLPLAATVMSEPSWRNVLRLPALKVLKGMTSAGAQNLYRKYAQ